MLAEIHGKFSREDQLTGDFFGAIRYLPFEVGLLHVLRRARRKGRTDVDRAISGLGTVHGYDYEVTFWPKVSHGEMDILVDAPGAFVCAVEVKYESGLSSDDDASEAENEVDDALEEVHESVNQLARYARDLAESPDPRPKHLILMAPASTGLMIADSVVNRKLIPDTVVFWLLTWQDALQALKEALAAASERLQGLILGDLVALLERKGFDCFRGFEVSQPSVCPHMYYVFSPNEFIIDWNSPLLVTEGSHYGYE
jgi:hypothetical protein